MNLVEHITRRGIPHHDVSDGISRTDTRIAMYHPPVSTLETGACQLELPRYGLPLSLRKLASSGVCPLAAKGAPPANTGVLSMTIMGIASVYSIGDSDTLPGPYAVLVMLGLHTMVMAETTARRISAPVLEITVTRMMCGRSNSDDPWWPF